MKRKIIPGLALLLLIPISSRADMLLLKSGETLRGTVLDKTETAYSFRPDSGGETVDVPISSVSIADIDPTSAVGSKPSIILYSGVRKASSPKMDAEKQEEETLAAANSGNSVMAIAPTRAGILKNAETTVAMSNARTAQMEKILEEAKSIADQANQIPAASTEA